MTKTYAPSAAKRCAVARPPRGGVDDPLPVLGGLLLADSHAENSEWSAYARAYASAEHRDHPENGCALAALAADAGRQGEDVQAAFAEHLEHITAALAAHLANEPDAGSARRLRQRALRTWSELVGAVILARAVASTNPELSEEVLEASRRR